MTKRQKYAAGQTLERWTPFIVEDRTLYDCAEDGVIERTIKSWRPGVRRGLAQGPCGDAPVEWDGAGVEIRRIVAVVPIEGSVSRILYRRSYRTPEGKEFGKPKVRMTTPSAMGAWRHWRTSTLMDEINAQTAEAAQ